MIPETVKLGIAMDYIDNKIAMQMIKLRKSKGEQICHQLENEYYELVELRKQVYSNNYDAINKIIKEMENNKND